MDEEGSGCAEPTVRSRRDSKSLLLASAVGLGLLGGLLVAVGPGAVFAPIAGADPGFLGLAVVAATGSLGCRHLAYVLLCRRTGASPLGPRFHLSLLVAGVPRWLLPFGYVGGPVVNATYLVRGVGARFEPTVAALAVSEVLALVASGFVLGVGFVLVLATGGTVPTGNLALVGGLFVALAAAAGALFVLGGIGRLVVSLAGLYRGLLGLVDRVVPSRTLGASLDRLLGRRVRRLASAVSILATDRRAVGVAFLINAVAWFLGVLPLYFTTRAVGLTVPIGVVMITVPLAVAAGIVPVPGGLGATEVAFVGVLVALTGVPPADATAATVLYRLSTMGLELALGGAASAYLIVRSA